MKKLHPTILVVDDCADDQFLIERAFRKTGVTDPIHLVSDGEEAISYMMGDGKYADRHQILVLHAYWMTCEVPEVDRSGRQLRTESSGKLGERFPQAGDSGGKRKSGMARTVSAAARVESF